MTLNELAIKYGSDKADQAFGMQPHGYCDSYGLYLPKEPNSLLEIGCMHGASLKMWKDYFPHARIATFDLFQNEEFASKESMEQLGIKCYQGDQGYTQDLSQIHEPYEVIIDDGSHRSDHQLISFKYLWKYVLKPRGVYVIEDLHCCLEESFRFGKPFEETVLGLAKMNSIDSLFHDIEKWVLINDKIIFIWKS